jgi:hypothetical protein
MRSRELHRSRPRVRVRTRRLTCAAAATAAALALAVPAAAETTPGRSHAHGQSPQPKLPASASLEECVSSASQEARAVTFAGEMNAVAGTAHMEMRVDVLERAPEETSYHRVAAPGLGVWRGSAPGVKSYRYLKQVTNLSAPAFYRGAIRFRWLNARGHQIAFTELHTHSCDETLLSTPTPSSGRSLSGSAPSSGRSLSGSAPSFGRSLD